MLIRYLIKTAKHISATKPARMRDASLHVAICFDMYELFQSQTMTTEKF